MRGDLGDRVSVGSTQLAVDSTGRCWFNRVWVQLGAADSNDGFGFNWWGREHVYMALCLLFDPIHVFLYT